MIYDIPKPVINALAQRDHARRTADALFQEQVALVTQMLGIPDGVECHIDYERGVITVPESS